MESNIDKKLVTKLAKEKLKTGKTKQEVYEELVSEFKYRNDIAEVLSPIPSSSRLNKYGIWNTIYLILLILITLLSLVTPTLAIIWEAWLIYVTATKKFQYYWWNTLAGVLAIISVFALSFYEGNNSWIIDAIIILISLIFIAAGVYLPKLLKSSYTEVTEPYINSAGENEIITKHIFGE